jgi:phospholipid/cholesterol/gamma-HCH transport system ATP-binding protein
MTAEATPDIEFREVWKTFDRSPEPTLSGLNLVCQPDKIHVLIGHSGSGKSVTLRHVLGLMQPDRGDVLVKGQSLLNQSDYKLREIRRNFGMLFQGSALFDSLSVYENVAFPLREHRSDWKEARVAERVHELLEEVGLAGSDDKMPSEISGGMQKRVGLARAMALDPKILLFDEPTTGLDPVTSKLIDELIVETTRHLKASALVISHDIHAALRIADFVSMLWKGKIIETATPSDLRKSSNEVVVSFLRSAGIA